METAKKRGLDFGVTPNQHEEVPSRMDGPLQGDRGYREYLIPDTIGPQQSKVYHINMLKKWIGPLPNPAHLTTPVPTLSLHHFRPCDQP